jgi:hypothetical protein
MNLAALTIAIVVGGAVPEPITLVENGSSRCCIVVPDGATPTIHHASAELASYVKRISGADVPIVGEIQFRGGTRIDIGLTDRTRTQLPIELLGDEERVLIRTTPEGVTVCGSSDRATLFAVYRFLESVGCRWLTPEPENKIVPRRPTLVVEDLHVDTKPAFQWRLFIGGRREGSEPWGVKMGLNGLYTTEAAIDNGACYYYPAGFDSVHTWYKIIPNERDFKRHPEWFPLLNGKRVETDVHGRQLCVTAPGLVDEFAKRVIQVFDEDPACRLMSISPNDGRGWCECEACGELDRRLCDGRSTQQGLGAERPFRGDRVFWFANEVAERVAAKHPDRKLLVLAYINYAEPPDTVRPHPNVIPFLCHYAPADYARAINDPMSEPNRQFNELLKKWVEITPNVLIYSYVSKSMWWQLPRPVLKNFTADIKYYHQLGIKRYFCQSSLSDWALDGPLYYTIAKLLWDPAADPKAIAAEWIDGMFGPAAEDMAEFYEAVDASVRQTGQPYSDNPLRDVPGLYDRMLLDEAMAAIQRAEQIPADEQVQQRIAEVAKTFRYGYQMVLALEEHHRFLETGDPEALKNAIASRDKAFKFRRVADAARRTESWKLNAELGVPGTGFGDAEEKGGRRCWNSDETGVGDGASGWATFIVRAADLQKPVVVEMDVWGESAFRSIVINSKKDVWNRVQPERGLSGKPEWETLTFRIPADLLDPERVGQTIGFGGADSQIWIANIRCHQP